MNIHPYEQGFKDGFEKGERQSFPKKFFEEGKLLYDKGFEEGFKRRNNEGKGE